MCTASGRKSAQQAMMPQRRQGARMQMKSEFTGGNVAFNKSVSLGSAARQANYQSAVRANERMGAEAGGYVAPQAYGGSYRDVDGGDGGMTEAYFGNSKASSGVSGNSWTGASGRSYGIKISSNSYDDGGEAGTTRYDYSETVGSGSLKYGSQKNDKGQRSYVASRGGIRIKTEDEARQVYKDFGKDWDKDEGAKADFYTTKKGRAPLARSNTQNQEAAVAKVRRIRQGGQQNFADAQGRRKGKKQGNLRISSAGVQGGQAGGGTSLS